MSFKNKDHHDAKWKEVATQAVTREEFKTKLVDDPVAVMKDFDIVVPEGVDVKIGTDQMVKLVVPENASEELQAEVLWWRWRLDIIREFGREEKERGVEQIAPEAEEGI